MLRCSSVECVPCPAGRYGAAAGLTSGACSGACAAGYYCPQGATGAKQNACGHAAVYCPEGSGAPLLVGAGFRSTGSGVGHVAATGADAPASLATRTGRAACGAAETCVAGVQYPVRCPAGQYLKLGGRGASLAQPAKADSSACRACPGGRYGGAAGLVSALCSGECEAGHACPPGSTNAAERLCGAGGGWFCPRGAAAAQRVAAGHYSTGARALTLRHRVTCAADARFGSVAGVLTAAAADAADAETVLPAALLPATVLHLPSSWGEAEREAADGGAKGVVFSTATLAVVEGSSATEGSSLDDAATAGSLETATYTVRLAAPPAAGAVVTVSIANPAGGTVATATVGGTARTLAVSPTALVFSAADWSVPQTVVVAAMRDGSSAAVAPSAAAARAHARGQAVQLTHTVASAADASYNGAFAPAQLGFAPLPPVGAAGVVLVDVFEAAPAAVLLSSGALTLAAQTTRDLAALAANGDARQVATAASGGEDGRPATLVATYSVRLTAAPLAAVTVDISTHDAASAVISPSRVVFVPKAAVPGAGEVAWDAAVAVAVTLRAATARTRSAQRICPVGHFCEGGDGGSLRPCPRGRFGATEGLATPDCSGPCPPGTACAAGSAAAVPCVAGRYCAGGEVSAPCPAGRFGARAQLSSAACDGECAPGHYCPAGSTSATAHKCPAGRYGAVAGLGGTACSGSCQQGHYCPAASLRANAVACSDPTTYCPGGSGAPLTTPLGHYAVGPSLSTLGAAALVAAGGVAARELAEAAAAAVAAAAAAAAAAVVGVGGDSVLLRPAYSASVPGAPVLFVAAASCGAGTYCEGGVRRACPAGSFGNLTALSSVTTRLMDLGGDPVGETTAACAGLCAPGHYCPAGSTAATQRLCPAGRYGAVAGLRNAECTALCARGHFCPAGSTSAAAHKCPAGRYGASEGLQTADCAADCAAGAGADVAAAASGKGSGGAGDGRCAPSVCARGYYCPAGSTQAQQRECGSAAFYCPEGAALPTPVSAGYHSVPVTGPGPAATPGVGANRRYGQAPCGPGHWCAGGVRKPCPAGRYGDPALSLTLRTAQCSGACARGHYCPIGSTSASALANNVKPARRCPAGRYGNVAGLKVRCR